MAKTIRKTEKSRKMSDIMKEMSERLLRDPQGNPSSEASHVAVFLANVAWNECVGLGAELEACSNVWKAIEAEKPDLWDELKSRDIDAMIDELVAYKKVHFPDDQRRILTCGGTPGGNTSSGVVAARRSRSGLPSRNATLRNGADGHGQRSHSVSEEDT